MDKSFGLKGQRVTVTGVTGEKHRDGRLNKITLIFNDHFRKEVILGWSLNDLQKVIRFFEESKTGNMLFHFREGKIVKVDILESLRVES